jgi:hypothetical protein
MDRDVAEAGLFALKHSECLCERCFLIRVTREDTEVGPEADRGPQNVHLIMMRALRGAW